MQQIQHARKITQRFKEIMEASGQSLSKKHCDELTLLIEAGLDSALLQEMDKVAADLLAMAHRLQSRAELASK